MAKTRAFVAFVCTSLQPVPFGVGVFGDGWLCFRGCVGGGDVMCLWCGMWCHEVGCEVRWSIVVGGEVTLGEAMWLVARCHVMLCDVMSCHAMGCHVMSFDAMYFLLCQVCWCHSMPRECSHVMRCHLRRSDAMQWDGMLWACDAMWLAVRSCCMIRRGCAMWWIGSWCAVNYGEPPRLRTSKYFTP